MQLAKTLYDGLNGIEEAHKNLVAEASAISEAEKNESLENQYTTELVRNKATLLFDSIAVEQLITLLDISDIFNISIRKNLEFRDWDTTNVLLDKVKYDKMSGVLTITGVLSQREKDAFNALHIKPIPAIPAIPAVPATATTPEIPAIPAVPEVPSSVLEEAWRKGLRDIVTLQEKQVKEMKKLFISVLSNIFGKTPSVIDDYCPIEISASKKRLKFIQMFLPYLRKELAHRFVVEILSNTVGLDRTTTDILTSETLQLQTPSGVVETLYTIFEKIKDIPQVSGNDWNGYLIPSGQGEFTFIIKNRNTTPSLNIDGMPLILPNGKTQQMNGGVHPKNCKQGNYTDFLLIKP